MAARPKGAAAHAPPPPPEPAPQHNLTGTSCGQQQAVACCVQSEPVGSPRLHPESTSLTDWLC